MKIFADLHLHSKYSRACSKDISLENLEKFAKLKGLNLLGTGDFQHPLWFKEIKLQLKEANDGVFHFKDGNIFFLLQTEVQNFYEEGGKVRKVHNLILAPNFDVVEQIKEYLGKKGDLKYDGRPILNKLTCSEMTESLMEISKDIMIIPAHAWTSWFDVFGSKSGFDSLEECFKDQAKNIHAIETGLSSDPSMNWRISALDRISLVSFSDAHSYWPHRLGRECCVFDLKELNYKNLIDAIKSKDKSKFLFTMEFFPEEGKYHWDGHRKCNVYLEPKEAIKHNNICSVCGKQLTIGVLHRVEELADREEGFVPKNAIPFKNLVPLSELLASIFNTEPFSKKVWEEHSKLINRFGNEFNVLLDAHYNDLKLISGEIVADVIVKNREGKLRFQPGYDGVYGKLILDDKQKIGSRNPQKRIDSFT